MDETVVSGGAKRRGLSQPAVTCWPRFGDTIYEYTYNFPEPDPPRDRRLTRFARVLRPVSSIGSCYPHRTRVRRQRFPCMGHLCRPLNRLSKCT